MLIQIKTLIDANEYKKNSDEVVAFYKSSFQKEIESTAFSELEEGDYDFQNIVVEDYILDDDKKMLVFNYEVKDEEGNKTGRLPEVICRAKSE